MPSYRANVTRVTSDGVFFRVPDLGIGYEFGPSPSLPGVVFAADDQVVVTTVSGAREDLVIVAGQGTGIALTPVALDDLSDVILTTPATGALLMYDGADWVDGSLAFDGLSDVTLTSPAVGHVLQHNGSAWVNSATLDMVGASGADVITTKVTGDSQKRFIANAQGLLEWGSGSAAVDTNLYRSAVGVLGTDSSIALSDGTAQVNIGASGSTGSFTAKRAASNSVILSGRVTTDTVNRVQVTADGTVSWGSGSGSVDTNLYRSAADTLKTDDAFIAVGGVTIKTIEVDPAGSVTGNLFQYNGTKYVPVAPSAIGIPGEVRMWPGPLAPTGWQLCDGTSLNRSTYPDCFDAVAPIIGTATMTIASPCVVTKTGHGLVAGDKIFFTTTGALPTGVSANTVYYVLSTSLTTDTFRFSATDGGSAINSSGSQSGTHTLRYGSYGIVGSTTFNVPNLKGSIVVGRDVSQTEFDNLGQTGGAKTHSHALSAGYAQWFSEVYKNVGVASWTPTHAHTAVVTGASSTASTNAIQLAGSTDSTSTLQPYNVMNYIIKL